MAINLDSLTPAELQALIKSAEAQMQSARKTHIQEVRSKIDGLLKTTGLTIDEVYPRRGAHGGNAPRAAVVPKYRNPENPAQTWSGRGKRPLWFSEALKKRGVTADSMLIGGSATTSSPAKRVASKAKKGPIKKSGKR